MYAMTGKFTVPPGKRDALVEILLRASATVAPMNGCRAYIVLEDMKVEDDVWVYEMWDDKEAHDASLRDDSVRALIAEAMPFISGPPVGVELRMVGGHAAAF